MGIPAPVKEHGFAIGGAALACGYLAFAGVGRYFGRHFKMVEGGSIFGAAAAIALVGEGAQWLMGKSRTPNPELASKLAMLVQIDKESGYEEVLQGELDPETLKAYGKQASQLKWLLNKASNEQLEEILQGCLEGSADRLLGALDMLRDSKDTNPKFSIGAKFAAQPENFAKIKDLLKAQTDLRIDMEFALDTQATKSELQRVMTLRPEED